MSPLAIIYLLFMLVFGLVFLRDCIRFRKQMNRYVLYGLFFGILLLAVDAAILLVVPDLLEVLPIGVVIVADIIALIRMILFTAMGMYCCALLNQLDLPLTRSLFEGAPMPQGVHVTGYLGSIILVVGLAVTYSAGLFAITSPSLSNALKELSSDQASRLGASDEPSAMLLLVLIEFAFAEEIIFRLGIQNYLAKQFKLAGRKYWVAIALSSAFWSLAHANILDPEWVKIVQVFPLGIALGFLFRKFGIESCIFSHAAFNVIMMYLGPGLISS